MRKLSRRCLDAPTTWRVLVVLCCIGIAVGIGSFLLQRNIDTEQTEDLAALNRDQITQNSDVIERVANAAVIGCEYQEDLARTLRDNQRDVLATSIPLYKDSPYQDAHPEQAAAYLKIYQDDLAALDALPIQDCDELAMVLRGRLSERYARR
jgi:hypothetical protein